MEAYLSAAGKISRLALASNTAPDVRRVQRARRRHAELPRRGAAVRHARRHADRARVPGRRRLRASRSSRSSKATWGRPTTRSARSSGERLVVTIDGRQVHLFDWDKQMVGAPRSGVPTPPIPVTAGLHKVGVTFLATNYAPDSNINRRLPARDDRDRRHSRLRVLPARREGAASKDRRTPPCLRHAEPPAQIFVCRARRGPREPSRRKRRARGQILSTLARRAYRRPVTAADVNVLMEFYTSGRRAGTFDDGIEKGLRRLLADPEFIYRREVAPASVAGRRHLSHQRPGAGVAAVVLPLEQHAGRRAPDAGRTGTPARAGGAREAGAPDDGRSEVGGVDRQLRRPVAEPAGAGHRRRRTPSVYPDFDDNLRQAFRRRSSSCSTRSSSEDRSVLDLLNADYTFVDERLAQALRDSERLRQPVPARDAWPGSRLCGVGCWARAPGCS